MYIAYNILHIMMHKFIMDILDFVFYHTSNITFLTLSINLFEYNLDIPVTRNMYYQANPLNFL
jgi:hypothetical protein